MRIYIYELEHALLDIVEERLLSPETQEALLLKIRSQRPEELLRPLGAGRPR